MKTSWEKIRDAIELEIHEGVMSPGCRLPTEPELAKIHDTGRHSVRRAISDLAKRGVLSVEQGRGTFVLPSPRIEYVIGRRTRLRDNFAGTGIDLAGEALGAEIGTADARIAQALGLEEGAPISITRRLTRADGMPVSFGALIHDTERFPGFTERRSAFGSVSQTYKSYGVKDYVRASTTVHSRTAKPEETQRLNQHPDLPVMIVRFVDALPDGAPIAYGEVVWSAARVKFTFETELKP